ncbi:MAG: hypothetical protein MJZ46_00970 [Bacteroidales bacterium]|nr:hypothetical protein [Bacteroidales bacterium]
MRLIKDKNGNTTSIDVTRTELESMSDGHLIEFCNENMELLRLDVVDYLSGRLSYIFHKCNSAVSKFIKKNISSLPLLMLKIQDKKSGLTNVDFDSDDISYMTIALSEMIMIHNAKRRIYNGEEAELLKYNLQKAVEDIDL